MTKGNTFHLIQLSKHLSSTSLLPLLTPSLPSSSSINNCNNHRNCKYYSGNFLHTTSHKTKRRTQCTNNNNNVYPTIIRPQCQRQYHHYHHKQQYQQQYQYPQSYRINPFSIHSSLQSCLFFSSSSTSTSTSTTCPFQILSIPKNTTYQNAKKSFLKIAMKNHPDTIQQYISKDDNNNNNISYEEKVKQSLNIFRNARIAFESLVEDENGNCILRVEMEMKNEIQNQSSTTMSNEQFE